MADVNDWGMKVSQPGFDVNTCEDKDLVMSSSFNLLKTKAVGLTTTSDAVAHGLAYIPIFFTAVLFASGTKGHIIGDDRTTTCDDTNVNLPATTKYYLFYQQGVA